MILIIIANLKQNRTDILIIDLLHFECIRVVGHLFVRVLLPVRASVQKVCFGFLCLFED